MGVAPEPTDRTPGAGRAAHGRGQSAAEREVWWIRSTWWTRSTTLRAAGRREHRLRRIAYPTLH